jgi:hypothetical protein|tara:strand:- start:3429 stop:3734 length:306 start_codon:yes stop_codon:yes gene_type:complete
LGIALGEKAALYFFNNGVGASELSDEDVRSFARIEFLAAGKDIRRRVPIFRPGVDAEMRLGDGYDAGHANRVEFVEAFSNHGCPGFVGGAEHRLPNEIEVV